MGRAGFHPSGGQGYVKGCVYRRLWLRTTLGSLSHDWWGCVLTLLVVWPEVFHHWNLQAVGWGKLLVPKWQPPGKLTLKRIPWVSTISVLVPRVSHRLPLSPSEGPPRPIGRSGPRSYGGIALPLVPVHMKPCVLLEWDLFPLVLWSPSTQAPLAFKAKLLWGLLLLMPDLQAGESDIGLSVLSPVREPL